jgi:hypothetical protein
MFEDCQSVFCNNVFMTSTNKSKGEDVIDFNVVFPICEFRSFSIEITFKPKYFAQNCLYKFYIFGPKEYEFEIFSWEPIH